MVCSPPQSSTANVTTLDFTAVLNRMWSRWLIYARGAALTTNTNLSTVIHNSWCTTQTTTFHPTAGNYRSSAGWMNPSSTISAASWRRLTHPLNSSARSSRRSGTMCRGLKPMKRLQTGQKRVPTITSNRRASSITSIGSSTLQKSWKKPRRRNYQHLTLTKSLSEIISLAPLIMSKRRCSGYPARSGEESKRLAQSTKSNM